MKKTLKKKEKEDKTTRNGMHLLWRVVEVYQKHFAPKTDAVNSKYHTLYTHPHLFSYLFW